MLQQLAQYCRKLGRRFNRGNLLAWLLHLPVSETPIPGHGLILIQVDGLSREQFARSIARGKLPFLRRLLQRERYVGRSLYSGLPASTPAVQAELFYGIRTGVPAFAFIDRESAGIRYMYQPEVAAAVEARLQSAGAQGLLEGGSAYADNFTGGAQEAHFCTSAIGVSALLSALNPLTLGVLILTNLMSVLRLACLLAVEIVLAVSDFFRGVADGRSFLRELKFVPMRLGASILLREICVIGGKIDINRGLPIIHMNFVGYDEQSHRRGPDSLFALWTLKGIDYAIRRVWRDARRAQRRCYDLWIYSDHGQCAAIPYQQFAGYPLSAAVERAWFSVAEMQTPRNLQPETNDAHQPPTPAGHYALRWLWSASSRQGVAGTGPAPGGTAIRIAAAGPVGFIHLNVPTTVEMLTALAEQLVNRHRVPAIIVRGEDGGLVAVTATGRHMLPQQIEALCGPRHPFLVAISEDLSRLCQHSNAGDLTLLGWRQGVKPLSFALENGAHGGISPRETEAFALLPEDAPMDLCSRPLIRPADIRQSALALLGRWRPGDASGGSTGREKAARQPST